MKVFWSWQSDTPAKNNHYFVRDALELALQKVADDLDLDEAARPELDHDTKGEPGLVSIVDTIFQKIKQAAVFVGDLTFVGKTDKGKLLPNPNVMIELGHAITSLGPERIILVSNRTYGGKPEDLPFDLRHRRAPITYELGEGAGTSERNKAKEALAQALASALSICLGRVIQETAKEATFPTAPARPDDRSTWLQKGEAIEHHGFFHGAEVERWEVLEEPRFYMRVIPALYACNKTPREIHDLREPQIGLSRLAPWQNGEGGVNSRGVVAVGFTVDRKAHAATQWFKKTSEIWAFNCLASFQQAENAPRLLSWGVFPDSWRAHLDRTLALLAHIGVSGPLQIEVGVTGIKDVKWGSDFGRYTSLEEEIYIQRVDAKWDQRSRLQFLTDAFNRLGEAYNQAPVNIDQFLKIR